MALLHRILQGKAPRGKMVANIPAAPEGDTVAIEGADAAGLTMTRPVEEPAEETVKSAPDWVMSLPALNASLNGLATESSSWRVM